MAGFSKLYVIGGLGGFRGADGVNPIFMQIWIGDADRQWLEPHYVDRTIRPMGTIRSLVPQQPDDPNSLIDACIAFFPKYFEGCPSLVEAIKQLDGVTQLDFHFSNVPEVWPQLREEARPFFNRMNIFEAVLTPVAMPGKD